MFTKRLSYPSKSFVPEPTSAPTSTKHSMPNQKLISPSKMTIAYKEAVETDYWLRLLHDNGYLSSRQFLSLNSDMKRILSKIIAIVKTTKANIANQK